MKVIVIANRNPDKPPEDFAALSETEAKKALSLVAEDFIREIYSMANGKGAIMICEAADEQDVRRRFAELPFMRNDLLSIEVHPVTAYRGIVMAAQD